MASQSGQGDDSEAQETSKPTFAARFLRPILSEIGLTSVYASPGDLYLLYFQRFVRLFAYGGSTLILASYLSALGHSAQLIGLFMTLTLAGDVVISFFLTLFADHLGRKATLALGSLMMSGAGVVFALCQQYWVLLLAAILGVISPNGNEIGPFRALEESIIAHLTEKHHRADVFAWYALLGSAGTACGMIVSGYLLAFLQQKHSFDYIGACRAVFWLYAVLGAVKLVLTLLLSQRVERDAAPKPPTVSETDSERQPLLSEPAVEDSVNNELPAAQPAPPAKPKAKRPGLSMLSGQPHLQRLLLQLGLLFALDSFASGLAPL
jgi:MFS family permease